ncbi:MAG: alpha/beta hydrolase [Planctomycetaceae bacterium]|nr:alpha/beta hydrolase [Planctomycetaceae bacterium]
MKCLFAVFLISLLGVPALSIFAQAPLTTKPIFVWPDLAPGETDRSTGTQLPMRAADKPPIIRIEKIRRPPMRVYPATKNANGSAVLILPGGGFGKVVPNLEGSEAADWLCDLGVTCFVLNYRTRLPNNAQEPGWKRPLQDAQRAMRWIRENSDRWNLDRDQIGLLAFSAGGQVGAILITDEEAAYQSIDKVDEQSFRPDFAMLVYPWNMYDKNTDKLMPAIQVNENTPPSFIIHTHDDGSTSLGSVLLYADMKRKKVPAELHVYETGGHGYGTRNRPNSNIGSWTDRATDWLARRLPR